MPTYQFRNKDTEETWEEFMSMSAREEYLKNNPNIETVIGAPGIISGVSMKPDAGFRDLLKTIKKNNIRSKIETF